MKVDRLLGILTILTQKNKVKAKDLAERFEVSLRTIYRDIEDIGKAGIPIITYPGGDGGIGIEKGFTLDKSALTREEMQSILLGLKSLSSVMSNPSIRSLIAKLSLNRIVLFHSRMKSSSIWPLFIKMISRPRLLCFETQS